MKDIYIFHGAYGSPEENWVPWLRAEFENKGYAVTVPKFPTPEGQNYTNWMKTIEPHMDEFNEETVLVGHSIGATFALCVLEKLNVQIAQTILVSGFLGLLQNEEFDSINKTITTREFDWEKIKQNSKEFHILQGDNDLYVPVVKAQELGKILAVEPTFIPNGGHLNADAGFTEFPHLVQLVS